MVMRNTIVTENALFDDAGSDTPALTEPSGFRYQDDIISEEKHAALVDSLALLDLKPFEFHGHVGNRRVVSFGLKYNFSRRSVEQAGVIPEFLANLLPIVAEYSGKSSSDFAQVGVNEYRPNAGIGWHKDKPEFGIIAGLSLSAAATMRFRKATPNGWDRKSHLVRPRSIYILDGAARTEWEHSIPPVDELRYSITFRTLQQPVDL
jgi:alkylated DNA repair dioxygenase AlkB